MVAAAVVLAVAALGFLIWFLVTRSPARQAWLTSLANVAAVVLPAWTVAAAMLTWVRKSGAADADRVRENGPGQDGQRSAPRLRPLSELDPFDLEVQRPVQPEEAPAGLPELPAYVPRGHDAELAQVVRAAAAGRSGIAVLVGGSSTGKTRACWEALRLLRDKDPPWRLWHPIDPSPPKAALAELPRTGPRTVVWLNEAQRYLNPAKSSLGGQVAAGLRELLRDPDRAPVLVLATLWPQYWNILTARPPEDDADPHAQARELLADHNITVPPAFTPEQVAKLAGTEDARLVLAGKSAQHGQVIQFLAGAPELLARYHNAPPEAAALISAAMDARRLGAGVDLPQAFLEAAAPGYLTDDLDGGWLVRALAYAAVKCRGARGPLTRNRLSLDANGAAPDAGHDGAPSYRLADYLDQYGRHHRHAVIPPASFWTATARAQARDLTTLGDAADDRGLLRTAAQLYKHAVHQDASAAAQLVRVMHRCCPGDHRPAQWAAGHAALHDPGGIVALLDALRTAGAPDQVGALLARDPAGHAALGEPDGVTRLLDALQKADALDQFDVLAARAADVPGNLYGVPYLLAGRGMLRILREAGAQDQADMLAARAAGHAVLDDTASVAMLLRELREAGAQDQVGALLARDPAVHAALDNAGGVAMLLRELQAAGAPDQVDALLSRDPAAHVALGGPGGIAELLDALREARAPEQVGALLSRDPAAHVSLDDMGRITELLRELQAAGAPDQVDALAARTADALVNLYGGVGLLAAWLWGTSVRNQATVLAARAAGRATLDDASGVAALLVVLGGAGAQDQVDALLARDPAAHAVLDNAGGVAMLLRELQAAGAQDQVDALLARDPAAHAVLDNAGGVAMLLRELQAAGAQDQATVLAARAAGHVNLHNPEQRPRRLLLRLPARRRWLAGRNAASKRVRAGHGPGGSAAQRRNVRLVL